jgi:hypothetical protein
MHGRVFAAKYISIPITVGYCQTSENGTPSVSLSVGVLPVGVVETPLQLDMFATAGPFSEDKKVCFPVLTICIPKKVPRTLPSLTGHLRGQQNLISDRKSTCPFLQKHNGY